jgi:hypothetical protein
MARLSRLRHVSQYGDVTMLGVSLAPSDDTIHGLTREGTGCLHSNSLDGPPQTKCQRQEIGSMFNEADYDSPSYQTTSLWESRFLSQDNEMDMPGPNSNQELTAWGNDLAGIGKHLVDHISQEYASYGKLMAD